MGKSKTSGIKKATHIVTICETLRQINDECQSDSKRDKKVRKLLADAIIMAKKMGGRLNFYADIYHKGEAWNKDLWKKNRRVYELRMLRGSNEYKVD